MNGCTKYVIMICGWLLILLCVVCQEGVPAIDCTRYELTTELKRLYGGHGALSDFVFFDKMALKRKTKSQRRPRNEIKKERKKSFQRRNRFKKTQNYLARVLQILTNNRNEEMTKEWTEQLREVIAKHMRRHYKPEFNFEFNYQPSRLSSQIHTRKRHRRQRTTRRKNPRKSWKTKIITRKKKVTNHNHRNNNDEYFVDNDDEENETIDPIDSALLDNYNEDDIVDDSDDNVVTDNDKEDDDFIFTQSSGIRHFDPLQDSYNKNPRQKRVRQYMPMQTSKKENYDFQRMRRSEPFDLVLPRLCDEEGTRIENEDGDAVRLCKTCYTELNFGRSVIPQFARSIECDRETAPNCLSGFGSCTQKVVYFTFQKQINPNEWMPFPQPLNVSCECECAYDSPIHRRFVGNSN